MGGWAPTDVLNAWRAWVQSWSPPTATRVTSGVYELYLDGTAATVMAVRGARPVAADIPGLLQAGRDIGAQTIDFTLGPDNSGAPPPTYVEMADAIATVDILAVDLDTKLGSLGVTDSGDLQVDEVRTFDQFADYERTCAAAWGYPLPTEASIRVGFGELTSGHFLVYRRGQPVGTGGYSLVEQVARLWGAAVVPSARGVGAYRALVAARIADAVARGATLGLVHAAASSSPILQRLGFHKFGEQRIFRATTAQ
ncbi:Uncharacterised protein [Mycobacteroides abscessus subsp. bolletii]|nr:Uncharacterised protein [Mycobacteroides abscessus subsp. bolletii]